MTTTPEMPDFRVLWKDIMGIQQERIDTFGKPRPITILGNYRTLNSLIMGQDQAAYLMFEKLIIRSGYGDIHFLPHKGHDDGELTFL